MTFRLLLAGLLLALPWSVSRAAAQTASNCLAPVTAGDTTRGRPDLLLVASARMDQIRFDSSPRAEVRLLGCAPLDSVRTTERRNLPRPVQPGVTYRDVSVGVEIRSYLNVRCLHPAAAQLCAQPGSDTIPQPRTGRPQP